MKNGVKMFLCLMLAALMLVPTLASCANNESGESRETQGGSETDNSNAPTFEDADFNEDSFKFLWYGSNATDYADEYIWNDGLSGSTIGDAVVDRNRLVEEKYNVVVEAEEVGGPMGEAVRRMQAGQCDFDVIYEWGIRSKSAALDGMLYDFLDLQDHIDLDQSYWVPSSVDDMTIGGHLFIYTNYISMNSLAWAGLKFFNREMITDLNLTIPYDYVNQNNWTYDVYLDMCASAASDLDGDGAISTMDDRFAALGDRKGLLTDICSAANKTNMIQMNDDGSVTLVSCSENCLNAYNTYSRRLETMNGLLELQDIWSMGLDLESLAPSQFVAARKVSFGQNHVLFLGGSMDETKEFTDQPVQYGVVPDPVYAPGDPYSAGVDCNAPMFSIPLQVEDEELVGIVMEYMAYESERILLPAFYEQTIKTKRMDDSRDYEMLDIIRSNTHQSWVGVYLFDTDYAGLFGNMVTSGNFASVFRRNQAKVQSQIDEVIEKLNSID